jgi:hypothetical protein
MSHENVEIVRRWVGYYNARDTDTLMSLTTADYEMKSVFAGLDSGGIFRAGSGWPIAYFKELDDVYEEFELVADEYVDAGAAVVLAGNMAWRGHGGAEGRSPLFAVFWLRAGKVFREESFTERAEALEAVGLRK